MNTPTIATDFPRYALVTGGGSGIGRALTQRLAALGWAVAVADIDLAAANQTVSLLENPGRSQPLALDVASADQWASAVESLRTEWPRLDLLINNAGILAVGPMAKADAAPLCRLLDVNLRGVVLGAQATVPWLVESAQRPPPAAGSPRAGVINLASIFAPLAPPGFAAYSASKAGVVAFSEALRSELQPAGLNVTVALPGALRTSLFDRASFADQSARQAAERYLQSTALSPESVAQELLRAAEKGRARVVIGRRAKLYDMLKHWFPRLAQQRVAQQTRQAFAWGDD